MANIATCPKCAKQLGMPTEFAVTDRAECPECHETFLLNETVQIPLPVARILEPEEQPTVENSLAMEVSKFESLAPADEALASIESAPLPSWEERLKKALALDTSNDEPLAVTEATKEDEPAAAETPSFEFELDSQPVVDDQPAPKPFKLDLPDTFAQPDRKTGAKPTDNPAGEPINESGEMAVEVSYEAPAYEPPKTLADFAATASAPTASALAATIEQPVVKDAEPKLPDEPQPPTVKQRRIVRQGFPKVAAFAVGPVVGTLLGLYGLLWLQGPAADHLGLAKVLPASMVPACDIAEADGAEKEEGLLASPRSERQIPKPLAPIKRDIEIQAVSASQPLTAASSSRITASEFIQLVNAAQPELLNFVASDFSSPEMIERKGQAYMAFCRLAERFAFAKQPGLAPAVQVKAKEAARIFGQVTYQASARRDLARVAQRWWEYEQRPSKGIFLAGWVQSTQPVEGGTLCWISLSEQASAGPIPVLLKHERYQTGDQIGVVGSVAVDLSSSFAKLPGIEGKMVDALYDYKLTAGQ